MNKLTVLLGALCVLAVVAFAGTGQTTCEQGIDLVVGELYDAMDTSTTDPTKIQCGTYKYSPKGIWFTYKGEGKAIILETCDQRTSMDSVIFVFKSCDKDKDGYINDCVAMDDDGCNQRQSRVTFTAEEDVTYHIYVAGFLNSTGIFYLASSEVLPPDNYQCTNAITVNNYPFTVEGETGTCMSLWDMCTWRRTAGLWYKVTGSGQPFIAHTCNANTNYDSVISVFADCNTTTGGGSQCLATNNDACYKASMVSWRSTLNSLYYVFVTGYNNARGRFTLAIEQRTLNPNSYCYEPIVITGIPFVYNGKTDYLNTTFSECRNVDGVHSMFFRLQGGNRKVVVTTCTSSSTVNDSVIDVYKKCEDASSTSHPGAGKECVVSNDDYCGLGAQVVFFAASDSYYIAVSSASPTIDGVDFSLAIMPYEDTKNDKCWFAEEIDSFPDVLLGNTTTYDECDQSCDGSRTPRRGGWYRYTHLGASQTITASTCNQFNALNATIEIYNDCNEMNCVIQAVPTGNCTNATFVAENGRTYNLFITDANPDGPGGYFHVDFYEEADNEHGECEEAWFVNRGQLPYRLEDNSMLSDLVWSSCDNKTMRGVWVAVIGTGTKLVATTCDSHTGYDTVLELYDHCPTADTPAGQYCMKVNDDNPSCGRSSEIEWQSNPGQYYWIFVTGFAGTSGIFVLNIFEKESMINAQCKTAVGIRNLPYYDYGLTTYCDPCNASCKEVARKGNWYEVVGNNHWITVSTCNSETDFATEVEVYLACNEYGGQICVNHNHDYRCAPKTEITFAGIKDQLFYIFVTGADSGVMEEGFFGLTVTEGDPLPTPTSSSTHHSDEGLTAGEGFLVAVAVVMGIGVICAAGAVGFGYYKRRHLSYQEISTSG